MAFTIFWLYPFNEDDWNFVVSHISHLLLIFRFKVPCTVDRCNHYYSFIISVLISSLWGDLLSLITCASQTVEMLNFPQKCHCQTEMKAEMVTPKWAHYALKKWTPCPLSQKITTFDYWQMKMLHLLKLTFCKQEKKISRSQYCQCVSMSPRVAEVSLCTYFRSSYSYSHSWWV